MLRSRAKDAEEGTWLHLFCGPSIGQSFGPIGAAPVDYHKLHPTAARYIPAGQ